MRSRHLSQEKGQSLVEFAAISIPLLLLVLGIFEFARAFYAYSTIVNAASEGARYGIIDPNNTDCIRTAVKNLSTALSLTDSNVSVSCPSLCAYDRPIVVTVNYTFRAVTPLVPDLPFTGKSTMAIAHVPSSLGTCPY